MSDNYKTLRVPESAWEEAKTQKEDHGRTWGEQIVRPDGDNDTTTHPNLDDIRDQLDRIESSAETAEQRSGSIERLLEELQG